MNAPSLYPFTVVSDIPAMQLTVLRVPCVGFGSGFEDLDFAIQWTPIKNQPGKDQRIFAAVRRLFYAGLLLPSVRVIYKERAELHIALVRDEECGEHPIVTPFKDFATYRAACNKVLQGGTADIWQCIVEMEKPDNLGLSKMLDFGPDENRDTEADKKLTVPAARGWFQP